MSFERAWVLAIAWVPLAWAYFEWPRTTRRVPLALKAVTFALILLALSMPRLAISTTRVALGVLVDTSASISQADLDRASRLAAELSGARGSNVMRVIPFARTSRTPDVTEDRRPFKLRATFGEPGRATDLEAAVREAIAALPPGMLPRLALISDGKENRGSIARAAWQAREFGIPIDTFALQGRPQPLVRLESVSMPTNAFTGEPFSIDLMVSTPRGGPAEVELGAEGRSLGKSQVTLNTGTNPVRLRASLDTPGALDLSVTVRSRDSGDIRVNQAVMIRKPKVLYLSQDPAGIDSHLPTTLAAAQFDVIRAEDFGNLKLSDYQLLVLNNWDLEKMPVARKNEVEQFVKTGGGLIVVGGERNVYNADKKVEDALDRTLPAKLLPPRSMEGTAVVLIIDKSSSMEGPKMELARQAATGAVSNLRPVDMVGVLIFDNSFRWAVPIRKADDRASINALIAGIFPDGGTQIAPALTEAYQKILPVEATYRHILLLTDGISEEGNSYALAREAKSQNVTISTIGLGSDVHREYLEKIAQLADGKFYFLKDPSGLEQIVLKDVMEHTGTTTVERPLNPEVSKQTEILEGVDIQNAPPLKGYVRFEAKPSAETILRFDPHEPLLIRWQYGLGRAAVFTSDAKSRWASDWVAWKGFDKFWTNLSRDLLPHTQLGDASAEYDAANGDLVVNYRIGPGVEEPATIPAIFVLGSDGFRRQMEVKKAAAGVFRGRIPIGTREGLFRVRPLVESRAFPEVGLYRPEVELTEYGSNRELLRRIAEFTGGQFEPNPKTAFNPGGRSLAMTLSLWPGLLGLAVAVNLAELVMRKWRGIFRRQSA
jgi:Ca-activated chloride channel family protein